MRGERGAGLGRKKGVGRLGCSGGEEAGPVVGTLGLEGEGKRKRRVGPKERMPGRFGLKEEGREREKLSNLATSNSIQI